jgi:hypothetical protein
MALSFRSFCYELIVPNQKISAFTIASWQKFSRPVSLATLMSKVGSPVPPDTPNTDELGSAANPQLENNYEAMFQWNDPSAVGNNAAAPGQFVIPEIVIRRASYFVFNLQPPNGSWVSGTVQLPAAGAGVSYTYPHPVLLAEQYNWNVSSVNKYGTAVSPTGYFYGGGPPGPPPPPAQVIYYKNGRIYGVGFQSNLVCTVAITGGGGYDPPGPWGPGNINFPGIPIQSPCDGTTDESYTVTASNSIGQSASLTIKC